jgi:DNA polymerase III delta prime subunit
VNIPKPSHKVKGTKWPTFKPPATTQRRRYRGRVLLRRLHSGYHYFIFDEVDNLTVGAQRALKSFLNQNDIVCVLTTNYLDKVDKGLLNRCVPLNFNSGSPHQVKLRVQHLLQQGGLAPLSDELIDDIIQKSDGSWRNIIPAAFRLAKKQKSPKP